MYKKFTIKSIIISFLSLLIFIQLLIFIFMDGIGGWANDGVSGFIEQANLKKSLGNWYQLVFYTVQTNLFFSIIGMFYFYFNKNQIYKTIFFCCISLLLFDLFAIFVFQWNSFSYNPYEATKTLFLHLINPLTGFLCLFFIRKEILLRTNILFYFSFYITFYYLLSIVIYYNWNFSSNADNGLAGKPLWIYGFFDFNYQIFGIPTTIKWIRILVMIICVFVSIIVGLVLFIFVKAIFNIKLKSTKITDFYKFKFN